VICIRIKFSYESSSERILKIVPHLQKNMVSQNVLFLLGHLYGDRTTANDILINVALRASFNYDINY